MKAIQITFDERLLARLDATEEAQRDGRSAVMRRAVDEYLRRRRRYTIAEWQHFGRAVRRRPPFNL